MREGRQAIDAVADELRERPRRWLVTGGAGFIGSHVVEGLVELGQEVAVLDNFTTGTPQNLAHLAADDRGSLEMIGGDIRDPADCLRASRGIDFVLHHAALVSVPGSIADPATTYAVNVEGFANMMVAARDQGVARFVYASSSAVYGDDPRLPKVEGNEGNPLSPYAASKRSNELDAAAFQESHGLSTMACAISMSLARARIQTGRTPLSSRPG